MAQTRAVALDYGDSCYTALYLAYSTTVLQACRTRLQPRLHLFTTPFAKGSDIKRCT